MSNTPPNTPRTSVSSNDDSIMKQMYDMISNLSGSANSYSQNIQDVDTLLRNTYTLADSSNARQESLIQTANNLFTKYNDLLAEKSSNSQEIESLKSQILQLKSDIDEKNTEKSLLEVSLSKSTNDKDSTIVELNKKLDDLYNTKESEMATASAKLQELNALKTSLDLSNKNLEDLQIKYKSALSELESKSSQFDSSLNSLSDKLGKDSQLNKQLQKVQEKAADVSSELNSPTENFEMAPEQQGGIRRRRK